MGQAVNRFNNLCAQNQLFFRRSFPSFCPVFFFQPGYFQFSSMPEMFYYRERFDFDAWETTTLIALYFIPSSWDLSAIWKEIMDLS